MLRQINPGKKSGCLVVSFPDPARGGRSPRRTPHHDSRVAAWDGWLGNVSGGLDCSASLEEITALCQEITGNTIPITSIPETRPNDLRLFLAG